MVQIFSVVGAALFASTAMAAPAMRRDGHKYEQYQYEQEQYVPQQGHAETTPVAEHVVAPTYAPSHEVVAPEEQYLPEEQYAPEYVYQPEEPEYLYEPPVAEHEVPEHEIVAPEEAHEAPVYEYESVAPEEAYESYVPEHTTEAVWAETTTAYAYPTYGSGSNQWGASYDDCVSQCVAKYGTPSAVHTPVAHETPVSGAVHTVMVAPTAGVLRYFPYALNATVGDTVRFVWTTPANHTATLSSELAICNRSAQAESRSFVSGIKNAEQGEQIFDVVVQTEEPQFFYCSVAEHCEKGMFGVINPKTDFGGLNTVGAKMNDWLEANPDLKASWSVIHESTKDTPADNWGNNFSLDGIPESAYEEVAANILWNRAMFGANPGVLENGKGAETPDSSPLSLVADLNTLLSGANLDPNANNVAPGTPTGALPTESVTPEPANSGASHNVVAIWSAALIVAASWMLF